MGQDAWVGGMWAREKAGEGWVWVIGGMCVTVVMVVGDGHITCDALVMCHGLGCLNI